MTFNRFLVAISISEIREGCLHWWLFPDNIILVVHVQEETLVDLLQWVPCYTRHSILLILRYFLCYHFTLLSQNISSVLNVKNYIFTTFTVFSRVKTKTCYIIYSQLLSLNNTFESVVFLFFLLLFIYYFAAYLTIWSLSLIFPAPYVFS